ncbi:MAG: tetratricopeptide repeat protein [Paludibacteraceae bacterium]|nr:tetratricopeptide repeat protein [Paludibacteraceae bacterium]
MYWKRQTEEKAVLDIRAKSDRRKIVSALLRNRILILGFIFLVQSGVAVWGKKQREVSTSEGQRQETVISDRDQFKFNYFFMEALRDKELEDFASAADNLYRCHLINPKSAVVFFELASLSSLQGLNDVAMSYAQRAVSLNPSNVRYKRALADLASRNDEDEMAISLYEELLQLDSEHAKSYYIQLVSLYSSTKQYDKACNALDKYAELTKPSRAITEEKFAMYLRADDKKKAFQQIDHMIQTYPEEFGYVSYKAEMYCMLGDTASADKTYQQAFKKNPNNPVLQYTYARYLHSIDRKQQAVDHYLKVIQNSEATFDVRAGAVLAATSDSATLLQDSVYDKFISDYPKEYIPYLSKGSAMYTKKDSSGYVYLVKSLEYNPGQENTWQVVTTYFSEHKMEDSTEVYCKKAIENFPNNSDFHYLLGFAYKSQKKDTSLVFSEWRKSVDILLNKENMVTASVIQGMIADYYYELKQTEKAFEAYEQALKYNPMNVMALNNYAYYLCVENKDLAKADRMSSKTIKSDPNNATFLDTYAWICFKQGEYVMASLYISQAYNHGGEKNPELLEHYGDILFKSGESKDSYMAMWKKALSIRESSEEPYEGLEKLKLKIKKETYVE